MFYAVSQGKRENVAFLFLVVVKHSAHFNMIKTIVMELVLFYFTKVSIKEEAGYKTKIYDSNLCTPAIIIDALFLILGQNLPPKKPNRKTPKFFLLEL